MSRNEAPRPTANENYDLRVRLDSSQEELVGLLQQRDQIDRRIAELQSDLVHLAALCRVKVPDPLMELGLTDAVRWVIYTKTLPAPGSETSPVALKELVATVGISSEFAKLENLLGNVQTITKRLLKAGAIQEFTINPGAEKAFLWVGNPPPAPDVVGWLEKMQERLKR